MTLTAAKTLQNNGNSPYKCTKCLCTYIYVTYKHMFYVPMYILPVKIINFNSRNPQPRD